jgi:hypothetical protein
MKTLLAVLFLTMFAVACGDESRSPVAPSGAAPSSLASCNDKPPGQQPSGNPANAPGNSSSLDKDCH